MLFRIVRQRLAPEIGCKYTHFFSILTPFLIRFFLNILKIKGLKRDFGTTAGLQKVLRGLLFSGFREEMELGGGVKV